MNILSKLGQLASNKIAYILFLTLLLMIASRIVVYSAFSHQKTSTNTINADVMGVK